MIQPVPEAAVAAAAPLTQKERATVTTGAEVGVKG